MYQIPTADALVQFLKDFTGSTNTTEIKQAIFLGELSMRNIELPALRCDPYAPENIGIADANGRIDIPADMNKPILFFKQGRRYVTTASATGDFGSTTITLSTTPQQALSNGMVVTGVGIAPGATILSITGPGNNLITLSAANIGAVSGTVTFVTPANSSSQTGPWIVYDRIGDRDIITQGMIAQLYLQPVNVPAVIRGKFSEVGQQYEFLPYVAQGDLINMYYYKAWPTLFAPVEDTVFALTGEVTTITGSTTKTVTVTVDDTSVLSVGAQVNATDDTGSFGGVGTVSEITDSTHFKYTIVGTPVLGTVTDVKIVNQTVQSNAVLATWTEGYVYSALREYYIKRHNQADAAVYQQKFDDAWQQVEDQNNKGKWSGGHTRFSSVWQPRQYRQYNIK